MWSTGATVLALGNAVALTGVAILAQIVWRLDTLSRNVDHVLETVQIQNLQFEVKLEEIQQAQEDCRAVASLAGCLASPSAKCATREETTAKKYEVSFPDREQAESATWHDVNMKSFDSKVPVPKPVQSVMWHEANKRNYEVPVPEGHQELHAMWHKASTNEYAVLIPERDQEQSATWQEVSTSSYGVSFVEGDRGKRVHWAQLEPIEKGLNTSFEVCAWRRTGACSPRGPREPQFDMSCSADIPAGISGFCDCNGNSVQDAREPGYTCSESPGKCDDVCRACAWRQTGDCSAAGRREPYNDQPCFAVIAPGASGFCDCNGDGMMDPHEQGYDCSDAPGNCEDVCQAGLPVCAWRQTGSCSPAGRREPHKDKSCRATIARGASGFCDCNGNEVLDPHERGYDCSDAPVSCADVCQVTWQSWHASEIDDGNSEAQAAIDSVFGTPCTDVASTGLGRNDRHYECSNLTGFCGALDMAEPVSTLCPVTCGTCERQCRDVKFTTFTEDDGRHSSCADLKHMCTHSETSARVKRLCPVTCGVCVGLIDDGAAIPVVIIRNHSNALVDALRLQGNVANACRPDRLSTARAFPKTDLASSGRAKQATWRIPQILHQTWKTDQVPAKYADELASWRRLHPHWQFEFWDDRRSRQLVSRHFPEYALAFDKMSGIKQADAARIVALYVYGGVYADIDVEAVSRFDELLQAAAATRAGVLLGEENAVHTVLLERRQSTHFVSNAVMASAPGHPFWQEVLTEIFQKSGACGGDPVLCTGPRLIDRLSLVHVRRHPFCDSTASGCIVRLPFDFFSPHIAQWNAGSMARGCSDLFGELGDSHRALQVVRAACQHFEQAVKYPAVLRSQRTFAVHHWQCSWCRKDPELERTTSLRELEWRIGNESSFRGPACR